MPEIPPPAATNTTLLPVLDISGPHQNGYANFESFCCELAIVVHGLPRSTVPYGRSGQRQGGLDARGVDPAGHTVGIQSKLVEWPGSATAVRHLASWVQEYDDHHIDHAVDRLIVCTPWPNDARIVDLLRDRNAETARTYEIEHWNQEVLTRLATPRPAIVARYFGAAWAAGLDAAAAEARAAAFHMGVDAYLDLEGLRRKAERSDLPPAERAAAWQDLASSYREAGFLPQMARDARMHAAIARVQAEASAEAVNEALRVAAVALDDLQLTTAQLVAQQVRTNTDDRLELVDLVSRTVEDPTPERVLESVRQLATSSSDLGTESLIALGLVLGELSLAMHAAEPLELVAGVLDPRLLSIRGTFEYARVAALLADAGLREVESADQEPTTVEGRVLLAARHGRRLALSAESVGAIACYEEAQRLAIEGGLEGPARCARNTIAVLRQWMPPESTTTESFFADLSADRLSYWSMGSSYGDYPNSEHAAGVTATSVVRSHERQPGGVRREDLVKPLVLAVRGGFLQDEVERHAEFAGWSDREGYASEACWHAIWGADDRRAKTTADHDTELDRVIEAVASPVPRFSIAACAALESAGCFATDVQAAAARSELLRQRPWRWGPGPRHGEARVRALAALGPIPIPEESWDGHMEFVGTVVGALSAGGPLNELVELLTWMLRWSPDDRRRDQLVEAIIEACVGDDMQALDRCAAYDRPLHVLADEQPDIAESLETRRRLATGRDLYGDDRGFDVESDLDKLRRLEPNTSTATVSGYGVPQIAFANARRWSDDETYEALDRLFGVAASPLDMAMTRQSMMRASRELVARLDIAATTRAEFASRYRSLAESAREAPPSRFSWGDDSLLWARALHTAVCFHPNAVDPWCIDRVVELLASTERSIQSLGAAIATELGRNEIRPVPARFLAAHPNEVLRQAAVPIAVVARPLDEAVLNLALEDPSWPVRMTLATHLDEVTAADAVFAERLHDHLAADTHALVRWCAARTRVDGTSG